MKHTPLALVFCLLFLLTATESYSFMKEYIKKEPTESTRISITLEERKEITPEIFVLPFSVNVTASKEADVVNILGSVDKAIRLLNFNYKGGSYSVYKNCWWEKGKRKCAGYKGELHYTFELRNVENQNKIIDAVEEIKETYGESISYSVSEPRWLVDEKQIRKAEEGLKLSIIATAVEFGKKAGEKLNKTCTVSNIDYDARRPQLRPILPQLYKGATEKTTLTEAPEPKKEESTISVRATVRYICK